MYIVLHPHVHTHCVDNHNNTSKFQNKIVGLQTIRREEWGLQQHYVRQMEKD